MEYLAALVPVAILSVFSALTAKYSLSVIPWLKVFRNPRMAGSSEEYRRLWTYLLCWIASSAFLAACIVYVIEHLSRVAEYTYEILGVDQPDTGGVGIFASFIFTSWLYLFFVRKTLYLLKVRADRLPRKFLGESPHVSPAEIKSLSSMKTLELSSKGLVPGPLREAFYLVPRLLAYPYRYFYFEVDHLVAGSARLLVDKYGPQITLSFFKRHVRDHENESLRLTMVELESKDLSGHELAFSLLCWKIKSVGFFRTRNYIDNHVLDTPEVKFKGKDKRGSPRLALIKCKPIHFERGGKLVLGHLSERSEDGRGWYLATREPVSVSSTIYFTLGGKRFAAVVAHTNILTSRDNYNVGFAIDVTDNEARQKLTELALEDETD